MKVKLNNGLSKKSIILTIIGTGSQSYKLDNSKIQSRVVLLQKYLDHQAELELQALYALQALVHKLDHPPGKLLLVFCCKIINLFHLVNPLV